MTLRWTYQSFDQLSSNELYAILQLRNAVFVVEQNCPYQDLDDKDQQSMHLCAWQDAALAGYCRILPPGVSYDSPSIGRVLTAMDSRKNGTGRAMMEKAIVHTLKEYDASKITISAQLYLKKFYESLGFEQVSDIYPEDNIPHIKMQYSL